MLVGLSEYQHWDNLSINIGSNMTDRFVHHLEHLMLYGVISMVIVAEIGFVIWLLLRWLLKNFNWSPVINIGESTNLRSVDSPIETTKVKKDLGPIEVGVSKTMIVDTKSDESSVKLDEKIKGKVKTQKDKLRSLRK